MKQQNQSNLTSFRLLCLTLSLVLFSTFTRKAAADLTWQDCHINGFTPKVVCLEAELPQNLGQDDGPLITVFATLIPALENNQSATPLVIFTGGPGQAGSDMGPFVNAAFFEIRKHRDLLLVDQRGTGRTSPIDCGDLLSGGLETEFSLSRIAAACYAQNQHLPIETFTLEAVVADAAHFIRLLGYKKVNLWGGSYGTRTAALFYRRYPDLTRSLIVDGVLAPHSKLFVTSPGQADRALGRLEQDCAASPACAQAFPTLGAEIEKLLTTFSQTPQTVTINDPLTGEAEALEVNEDYIANMIRTALYSPSQAALLPYVITEANQDNFNPIFAMFENANRATETMFLGATLSILCSDEVPRIDAAEAPNLGESLFTDNSYYRFWASGCEEWPIESTAAEAFQPLSGSVPVLALSGDLDPVTGPDLADIFIEGFANSRHIIVPNAGHNVSHLACMPELMAEFLHNLEPLALDATCFEDIQRPEFVTSSLGPTFSGGDDD